MVVQHNLRAMNSNRMLGLTANVQSKSTEKLSSGYKINRAADDAAGLSISEKMRKQIRGLSQASLNAADGISAVQTAEGALNEVQDMLQRMNELAVKAANGTMSKDDRSYIQNEIDQLTTEINRVAETTKFNETYLLKGEEGITTKEIPASVEVSYKSNITGKDDITWIKAGGTADIYATKEGVAVKIDGNNYKDYFEVADKKTAEAAENTTLYKNIGKVKEFTAEEAKDLVNVAANGTVTAKTDFIANNGYLVLDETGAKVTNFASAFTGTASMMTKTAGTTVDADTDTIGADTLDGFEISTTAITDTVTWGDIKTAYEQGTLTKGGQALTDDDKAAIESALGYTAASATLKEGYTITKELTVEEQYVEATEEDIIAATKYDENGNAVSVEGLFTDKRGTAATTEDVVYDTVSELKVKDGYAIYPSAADDTNDYGGQRTEVTDFSDYIKVENDLLLDKEGNAVTADKLGNYFDENGKYTGGLYKKLTSNAIAGPNNGKNAGEAVEIGAEQIDNYVNWEYIAASTEEEVTFGALHFSLQVGADTTENNKISIDISSMSAKSLGVENLKVDGEDSKNADAAVGVIAEAIQLVSTQRSALGAVQNRLEHTIANLDNVVENTTAAESQIRDTDMATEMVKFSNNNILAQAGQAMLAQANQANQGVLSLLG